MVEEGLERTPPLEDSKLAIRVPAKSEPILVTSPRLFAHAAHMQRPVTDDMFSLKVAPLPAWT